MQPRLHATPKSKRLEGNVLQHNKRFVLFPFSRVVFSELIEMRLQGLTLAFTSSFE